MATFLIDYENEIGYRFFDIAKKHSFPPCGRISEYWKEKARTRPCTSFLETVKRLGENKCSCNNIFLFHSKNSSQKNIEAIQGSYTEYFEYKPNGIKNGLDFQLTTYLGNLLHIENPYFDSRFYIVSGDKGFNSTIRFWQENYEYGNIYFKLLATDDDIHKALFMEEIYKRIRPIFKRYISYLNTVDDIH